LVWFKNECYIGFRKDNDSRDRQCRTALVKLLLANGANPNERCHGLTPWSTLLQKICSGRDGDWPQHPWDDLQCAVNSILEKLEIAKLMLEHGADPFFCMEAQGYTISPRIFAQLLERQCCTGNSLNDCECAYARRIQPQLTELVELVEERKYMKEQMRTDGELLVRGVWLVVVLAYILQSFLISSFWSCHIGTRRSGGLTIDQKCMKAKGRQDFGAEKLLSFEVTMS
jgi:hypothetical protein